MSRNASGTYTLPSGNPVVTGTLIESSWANTTLSDLASAMTDSLSRSAQGGMTAALRLYDGTSSVPGLAWGSETTTGWYRSGAGDMRLVVTGSEVVKYLSTGVAVTGTLSVSGNTTVGGTLAVTGAVTLTANPTLSAGTANGVAYLNGSKVLTSGSALTFDGTNLKVGSVLSTGNLVLSVDNSANSMYVGGGSFSPTELNLQANSFIRSYIGGSEQMRLTSTGLGIGTSSPNGRLQVTGGTANASNLATAYSAAAFTLVPKSTSGFSLAFGSGPSDFPYIQMSAAGSVASDMTLQPYGGNVGIGTSSPTAGGKLDVNGIAYFGTGDKVKIYSNNVLQTAGTLDVGTIGSAALILNTANTERARIDSSGNLLVGTASFVYSSERISVLGNSVADAVAAWKTQRSVGQHIFLNSSGGLSGFIQWSGSTTAYNTSSDYRLKENIQPMTGALAKVTALKPCTYKWKADDSDGEGFIAHELAEVCPQAVTGEKDAVDAEGNPQYQGIDTSFLVATLTAAIQELKAIVDAQGAEIAALKAA